MLGEMSCPRVISLLPSATEIIHAIGRGDTLVGRSHECDFPPGVERLPAVSTARIDSDALDPAQIDAAVAAAIADGEQLYGVSADALAELAPDVVVTQTLCRVCAVEGDGVRSTLAARALEAEVVELEPEGVDGVLASIVALGDLLGAPGAARVVVRSAHERLASVRETVAGLPRPGVVVVEWTDPPYAAGHWVPELVEIAGGRELLGVAGTPSARATWEEIRHRAPEVVVIAPCGFDLDRTVAEATPGRLAGWLAGTPALRDGRVWAIDANAYLSRPGPRIVDGAELLAAILHPGRAGPVPPTAAAAIQPTPLAAGRTSALRPLQTPS